VGGCPVHTSQSLLLHLRAANHDPKVFPDPRRFDITRKDAPHVAFGGGLHACVGAPLGRMMGQVAIQTFFDRFPNARLAYPNEQPQWSALPFFRGLKTLTVAIQ
jgi:cytochrome P450